MKNNELNLVNEVFETLKESFLKDYTLNLESNIEESNIEQLITDFFRSHYSKTQRQSFYAEVAKLIAEEDKPITADEFIVKHSEWINNDGRKLYPSKRRGGLQDRSFRNILSNMAHAGLLKQTRIVRSYDRWGKMCYSIVCAYEAA